MLSVNYWVHRQDDAETDLISDQQPTDTISNDNSAADSNFGSKCLDSPGTSPCPIDACIVYKGKYSAKNVVTSELFGKKNPNDYQCCAGFHFTNSSGVDLMGFEHQLTEYDDNWYFKLYPAENSEQSDNCSNFFTRNDGKETLSKGVIEIVVLFANPHCDWIQWDEPGLAKYRMPVDPGCYSN